LEGQQNLARSSFTQPVSTDAALNFIQFKLRKFAKLYETQKLFKFQSEAMYQWHNTKMGVSH